MVNSGIKFIINICIKTHFCDLVSKIFDAMSEAKNDIVLKLLTRETIIRNIVQRSTIGNHDVRQDAVRVTNGDLHFFCFKLNKLK